MISGFFDSAFGFPHVWVRLSFEGRPPALVPFLIDTGASTTVVHAHDARRYLQLQKADLDPRQWPQEQIRSSSRVGGLTFYRVADASYEFPGDDGALGVINASVDVGGFDTERLPSLMGWDLLRRFRIELDRGAGAVTLVPR